MRGNVPAPTGRQPTRAAAPLGGGLAESGQCDVRAPRGRRARGARATRSRTVRARRRGRARCRSGSPRRSDPARCAASSFCFSPPIGSTRPCNVTSPVMPTPAFTGRPVTSDATAVVIVMPADGPSFGIAPDGTCKWNLRCSNASLGHAELLGVGPHERQRDLRRLRHHVAELAGHLHAGLAVHRGDLDREHVATGARDRETGREPGHRRHASRPRGGSAAGRRSPSGRARRPRRVASPAAILRTALRVILPSCRSRPRTPASRVQPLTSAWNAASVTSSSSSRRPAFSRWRGNRWCLAIATFSSSV